MILVKAQCRAEMKKTVVYNLRVSFDSGSSDITYATCGCPAGCGPTCVCKHLGALCYFMEDVCRNGTTSSESCTSSLQTWHQPGKKRKSDTPTTLDHMKFFKAEYGKEKRVVSSSNYDPRPSHLIGTSSKEITALQNSLKLLGKPVALLHVLPSDDLQPTPTVSLPYSLPQIPRSAVSSLEMQPKPLSLMSIKEHGLRFVSMITPLPVDRQRIEEATRKQSQCARWFEERYGRITSSHFGSLCKGSLTTAKIESIIQSSRHDNKQPPTAIQWGVIHEDDAYKHYQLTSRHGSHVRKAGIYIADVGFIASSPDGVILNPEGSEVIGIIEIKCPYSCRGMMVAGI